MRLYSPLGRQVAGLFCEMSLGVGTWSMTVNCKLLAVVSATTNNAVHTCRPISIHTQYDICLHRRTAKDY